MLYLKSIKQKRRKGHSIQLNEVLTFVYKKSKNLKKIKKHPQSIYTYRKISKTEFTGEMVVTKELERLVTKYKIDRKGWTISKWVWKKMKKIQQKNMVKFFKQRSQIK